MENLDDSIDSLLEQIQKSEAELNQLRTRLHLEQENASKRHQICPNPVQDVRIISSIPGRWPLSSNEYQRYGRQMILPDIGLQGQLKLKDAAVLIVGVGGLGCPAATYLAGAGIGTLGLVDGDVVEISNLHRQFLHNSTTIGRPKVDSAIKYLEQLNPNVKYVAHRDALSPQNAPGIFEQYDVILDCTDHPTSRYLISDTAVILGTPLVSASALRTEGQLMVLNYPARPAGNEEGGPCYRCIFPKPPPAETVTSCGEGGILGPVVGIMGVLQALETIKLLCGRHISLGLSEDTKQTEAATRAEMLMFSAYSSRQFRKFQLRSRRKDCAACSKEAIISAESMSSGSIDYVKFCGTANLVNTLSSDERISASDYAQIRRNPDFKHVLLDVRDNVQFSICNLPESLNIPLSDIPVQKSAQLTSRLEDVSGRSKDVPIYVVCRFGNDSQEAVRRLKGYGLDTSETRDIKDIVGGYEAWRTLIDPEWPAY